MEKRHYTFPVGQVTKFYVPITKTENQKLIPKNEIGNKITSFLDQNNYTYLSSKINAYDAPELNLVYNLSNLEPDNSRYHGILFKILFNEGVIHGKTPEEVKQNRLHNI